MVTSPGSIRDTAIIIYRCFLPDLTRFISVRCAAAGLNHSCFQSNPRRGNSAPHKRISGYKVPLAPRLSQPGNIQNKALQIFFKGENASRSIGGALCGSGLIFFVGLWTGFSICSPGNLAPFAALIASAHLHPLILLDFNFFIFKCLVFIQRRIIPAMLHSFGTLIIESRLFYNINSIPPYKIIMGSLMTMAQAKHQTRDLL
jgi:hypothetical protein